MRSRQQLRTVCKPSVKMYQLENVSRFNKQNKTKQEKTTNNKQNKQNNKQTYANKTKTCCSAEVLQLESTAFHNFSTTCHRICIMSAAMIYHIQVIFSHNYHPHHDHDYDPYQHHDDINLVEKSCKV